MFGFEPEELQSMTLGLVGFGLLVLWLWATDGAGPAMTYLPVVLVIAALWALARWINR